MIPPGSVKICSLRKPEHGLWAVAAGANLVGLIFVDGRSRYVDPGIAAEIADAVRGAGSQTIVTGVFDAAAGEASAAFVDRVNRIAERVGLDLLQIHRLPEPEVLDHLERPVLLTLSPAPGSTAADIGAQLAQFTDRPKPPVAFTIDGFAPGKVGGTGETANWALVRALGERWPVVLAGGLRPDNVAAAIEQARPLAVDVSGGVERDGAKNRVKIEQFVSAARRAFAAAAPIIA